MLILSGKWQKNGRSIVKYLITAELIRNFWKIRYQIEAEEP